MTRTTTSSTTARARTLGAAMVLTLLVQLLVGMANTLWLTVPDSGSGWATASPAGLLMAHIGLGTLLLVLAVWIALLAWRGRDRTWLTASAVGVLGVVIALGAGLTFMSDVSNDVASYLMAAGTVIAIAGYVYGLYRRPAVSKAA